MGSKSKCNTNDGGAYDEQSTGQHDTDDDFTLDRNLELPQERKGNTQNGGIGNDIKNDGNKEILELEGAL